MCSVALLLAFAGGANRARICKVCDLRAKTLKDKKHCGLMIGMATLAPRKKVKQNVAGMQIIRELCRVGAYYCQAFIFTNITKVGKAEREAHTRAVLWFVKKISKVHVSSSSMEMVHFLSSTILMREKHDLKRSSSLSPAVQIPRQAVRLESTSLWICSHIMGVERLSRERPSG